MLRDYNVDIDDSCATTFALSLRRPSYLPRPAGAGYHNTSVRALNQVNGKQLDAVRPDQFRGFCLELWELQDRDLGRIVQAVWIIPHCGTASAPKLFRVASLRATEFRSQTAYSALRFQTLCRRGPCSCTAS